MPQAVLSLYPARRINNFPGTNFYIAYYVGMKQDKWNSFNSEQKLIKIPKLLMYVYVGITIFNVIKLTTVLIFCN